MRYRFIQEHEKQFRLWIMCRVYEAVEKGLLPMDLTLQERVHKHQARKQELLTEMAGLRREKELPLNQIKPAHVDAFCTALKRKLEDRTSGLGKEYLKLLVDEIRVEGNRVCVRGNRAALAKAITNKKLGDRSALPALAKDRVPSFGSVWLPGVDSNH